MRELVTMMKITIAYQTTASRTQHELDLYVTVPAIARDQCPLRWWAANMTSYPLVAKVAQRLLAIPATWVASERLFSKAGDVIKSRFRFFFDSGKKSRFSVSNTGIVHH